MKYLPFLLFLSLGRIQAGPVQSVLHDDTDKPLLMAYYPDWYGESFPPENVDFAKFDYVDFAFAVPNSQFGLSWDDPETAPGLLTRLVIAAHQHGKKVKLSIGGWTGCKYFSTTVSTALSRRLFVDEIAATYAKFDLDGIDIDWEYPGQSGLNGNQFSPDDTPNFLLFLLLLRQTLPANATITAAVQQQPFIGFDGRPMTNLAEFARVLNWVLLMNYDTWGASAKPGPNSPFYNACHNSSQPSASVVSAFTAWTAAGFHPSQLVLGIPFYGYVSETTASSLRDRGTLQRNSSTVILRGEEGQISFRALVEQGALEVSSSPSGARRFTPAGGFERGWDACSGTPFLRSLDAGQVVAYDDPDSLGAKALFVKQAGMRGVDAWEMHGDTDDWALTGVIEQVFGRI